jgi:hypothetical protein
MKGQEDEIPVADLSALRGAEPPRAQCYKESAQYARELNAQGKFLATARAAPPVNRNQRTNAGGETPVKEGPICADAGAVRRFRFN